MTWQTHCCGAEPRRQTPCHASESGLAASRRRPLMQVIGDAAAANTADACQGRWRQAKVEALGQLVCCALKYPMKELCRHKDWLCWILRISLQTQRDWCVGARDLDKLA